MIIRINKTVLYWVIVFILEFGCLIAMKWEFDWPRSNDVIPIEMSQSEFRLLESSINLVLVDIDGGVIKTTEDALDALQAELPKSVAASVLRRIGHPEFNELPVILRALSGKIKIRE